MSTEPSGVVLVTGAGGFVGGHLIARLLEEGAAVRATDVKAPAAWHQHHPGVETLVADLSDRRACDEACDGATDLYDFASDMGGMGFLESHKALCMLSVLVSTNLLLAARDARVRRFFFASSACVYATDRQVRPDAPPLTESEAYPAMPEDGYGWEKLFSERMCRHFHEDFGLETRVARYHNLYGPACAYDGGREQAPAALCRKVAEAVLNGSDEIEIWGDGKQTRTFTYVTDAVDATRQLVQSDFSDPVNIGSEALVSIDELVTTIEAIARVTLRRRYMLDAPQGVRGRSCDSGLARAVLDWQPKVSLTDGLEATYRWVYDNLRARHASAQPSATEGGGESSRGIARDDQP
jgi:GDP-D-mannose 3',5'-epimerase